MDPLTKSVPLEPYPGWSHVNGWNGSKWEWLGNGAAIHCLKEKFGVDKKQPYQLLNINHEFFPSFDASNFHKLVNDSS